MALAQKGSRKLVVDGIAYRWSVRRKPTYCQEMGWGPMTFAVTGVPGGFCLLHVQTSAMRPDSISMPGASDKAVAITPALVTRSIRLALQQGWQPYKPGSAFELSLEPDTTGRAGDMPPPGN